MRRRAAFLTAVTVAEVAAARWALAAQAGAGTGVGLWTVVFLAFAAVVVLFQAVPAVVMFGSMVAALFQSVQHKARLGSKAEKTG